MQIEVKKPISILFARTIYKELKVFATINDVTLNDAIKMLLDEYKKSKGE